MNALKDLPNNVVGQWVRFVAAILLIPGIAWIGKIQMDVTAIQANRYTSRDALIDQARYQEAVTAIWQELSDIRIQMAQLPPDDFERKVDRMLERIHKLEIELAGIER